MSCSTLSSCAARSITSPPAPTPTTRLGWTSRCSSRSSKKPRRLKPCSTLPCFMRRYAPASSHLRALRRCPLLLILLLMGGRAGLELASPAVQGECGRSSGRSASRPRCYRFRLAARSRCVRGRLVGIHPCPPDGHLPDPASRMADRVARIDRLHRRLFLYRSTVPVQVPSAWPPTRLPLDGALDGGRRVLRGDRHLRPEPLDRLAARRAAGDGDPARE